MLQKREAQYPLCQYQFQDWRVRKSKPDNKRIRFEKKIKQNKNMNK